MNDHPYREVHVGAMHGDLADAVASGPHSHWSEYDAQFEGARWQRVHEAVVSAPFEAAAAAYSGRELEALAYGYGYSRTDSYLADTHGLSEEEISNDVGHSTYRQDLFGRPSEGGYMAAVFESQARLLDAATTPQASSFVSQLVARIEEAFVAGRDQRVSESPAQGEEEDEESSFAP